MNLIFQSVSKCFGPQEDEIYNEGYSLNSRTDDSELELTVLFIKEDEEFVNSLQQGQEFEVNVKFIGYDQLYSKPIFGKIDDEPQIFEDGKDDISNNQNSSQSLEENIVVSKHTSPDESGLTKTKQESYSYKSAEPYDYGIDDTNKKFEDINDLISIEEPLEISLKYKKQDKWINQTLSITMRTPGNDEDLVRGFLFNEQIVKSINDIESIEAYGNKVGQYKIQNKILATLNNSGF